MASPTACPKQGSRAEVLRETSQATKRKRQAGVGSKEREGLCSRLASGDLPKGAVLPKPGQMPTHTKAACVCPLFLTIRGELEIGMFT